jgi:methionine-rich copper-binding protein CopC
MKHIVVIAAVTATLFPLLATAHTELKQSAPANGSVVKMAPKQIMLMFSETATLTALSIQKTGDKEAYVVKYRALSNDSHVAAGTLKFSVSTDKGK